MTFAKVESNDIGKASSRTCYATNKDGMRNVHSDGLGKAWIRTAFATGPKKTKCGRL